MKQYIEETLIKNEKILVRPTLHWFSYWRSTVVFSFIYIVSVLFLGFFDFIESSRTGYFWPLFLKNVFVMLFAFLPFVLVFFIYTYYANKYTEMALTSKRVVRKRGIFWINTNEIQNSKIESVEVKQGLLGKLFNYGDVCFSGTGSTWVTLAYVFDPLETKKQIAGFIN